MPEIGEVARIVHFLRKTLVGKTLASVKALDDANVFGKVGTSHSEFQTALTGKKVMSVGQKGKYFWLLMASPPHPLFHLGMTGWIHIKGQQTYYYKSPKAEEEEWPPKYWKFTMETTGTEKEKIEAAFTDPRRFARIRLINCAAKNIRITTPLKENGPDPVEEKDIFTQEFLEELMNRRKVPVKALLLDQANISGIGNWVGDEILYHAKFHPEQYCNTFSSAQIKQLHTSIRYVCQTAVDLLSDSSKFPDDWLFKHRWGKGKKDKIMALPNGEKITFLKVGGRTSCVVPSVQKKTGAVAGDIKDEDEDNMSENSEDDEEPDSKPRRKTSKVKKGTTPKTAKTSRKKTVPKSEEEEEATEEEEVEEAEGEGKGSPAEKTPKSRKRKGTEPKNVVNESAKSSRKKKAVNYADEETADEEEEEEDLTVEEEKPKSRKRKEAPTTAEKSKSKASGGSKKAKKDQEPSDDSENLPVTRRRSGRVSK